MPTCDDTELRTLATAAVFSYGPNRAAEITAISTSGAPSGTVTDDMCVTSNSRGRALVLC